MEKVPTTSFAVLLRTFRVAAGLSQEALAVRAGLSTRAISDLERGVRRAPYRESVRMLADALDLSPAERGELETSIVRSRGPRAGTHSLGSPLPAMGTPLIGRDQEIASTLHRIQQERSRLVTLTGPPGIGKTRLALGIAAEVARDRPDEVVFVELAPLRDPRLVATSILQALGLSEVGERPALDRLKDVLASRRALLVLDNFEQVVEAAPLVGELLESAPELSVLVTSRVALHLRGEQELPVSPLAVARPSARAGKMLWMPSADDSPAVALFVARALAVHPDFEISADSLAAVAEVCHRLDGLPLAIELAAARSKVLNPQAILVRLEHRLDLLTGGPRDAPARHQTLRLAIAWSYDLLPERERIFFRRLGVFVGGFTVDEAARLCTGMNDSGNDALDRISTLVEHSLVRMDVDANGEPRFSMLETLREFAIEQLADAGELQELRARHAGHVLTLAEDAEPHLFGGHRGIWIRRLNAEQDNIRQSLGWALEQDDPILGLQLVGALWLWFQRRLLREGRWLADQLLAHPGGTRPTVARANALFVAGHFAWLQGDVPSMRNCLEESAAILRELDDEAGLGRVLPFLGLAIGDDPARAALLATEGVALGRATDRTWDLAMALINQGRIAATWGNDNAARAALVEGADLFRMLGDQWLLALALTSMGSISYRAGDFADARSRFEEALARFLEIEDRRNTAQAMTNLGFAILAEGDAEQARRIFAQSLAFGQEHGDLFNLPACLRGIGAALACTDNPIRGARFVSAADRRTAETGAARWPAERLGGPGTGFDFGDPARDGTIEDRQGLLDPTDEDIITEALAFGDASPDGFMGKFG